MLRVYFSTIQDNSVMAEYKYPLEQRFVQVKLGNVKLINLQIIAWLRQNGYSYKNDSEYLYFESEEILAHFIMVWCGTDKLEEYWDKEGALEILKHG